MITYCYAHLISPIGGEDDDCTRVQSLSKNCYILLYQQTGRRDC